MSSKLNECQVTTGEVRLSYVNLFEAKKFKDSDKDAKFSVPILIDRCKYMDKLVIVNHFEWFLSWG